MSKKRSFKPHTWNLNSPKLFQKNTPLQEVVHTSANHPEEANAVDETPYTAPQVSSPPVNLRLALEDLNEYQSLPLASGVFIASTPTRRPGDFATMDNLLAIPSRRSRLDPTFPPRSNPMEGHIEIHGDLIVRPRSMPRELYPAHHAIPDSYPDGTRFKVILRIPNEYSQPIQDEHRRRTSRTQEVAGYPTVMLTGGVYYQIARNYLEARNPQGVRFSTMHLQEMNNVYTDSIDILVWMYTWNSGLYATAPGATVPIQILTEEEVTEYLQHERD